MDTGVCTDDGTFVKPDSSPKITIEDEEEYKLIAWKTSTTYKPDIESPKWKVQCQQYKNSLEQHLKQ